MKIFHFYLADTLSPPLPIHLNYIKTNKIHHYIKQYNLYLTINNYK